jgi:hypothetical protein
MYVNPGYQKWTSAHKYVNQNKPVLIAKRELIYFVKYLYSEIVMHIGL